MRVILLLFLLKVLTFGPNLDSANLINDPEVLEAAPAAVVDPGFRNRAGDNLIPLHLPPGCGTATIRFAAIGDYGKAGSGELAVANRVKSWNPNFIITLGDNNYPTGQASTIDANIGQYYHQFIGNYGGSYGPGAATNNFYPSLGNHDWDTRAGNPPLPYPYLNYFTLPGNERYYNFKRGPVEFFVIDSDSHEPDGRSSNSIQANWLRDRLAASTAAWKVVYMHHAPYTSSMVNATTIMRWPYQTWGATTVLAGHTHTYERLIISGFPYFVNGLGGAEIHAFKAQPDPGSVVRYNQDYGAMRVEASSLCITFEFITRQGVLIDSYTISGRRIFLPLISQK